MVSLATNLILIKVQSKISDMDDNTRNLRFAPLKSILVTFIVCATVAGIVFVGKVVKDACDMHEKNTITDLNGNEDFSLNTLTIQDVLVSEQNTMIKFGKGYNGNQTNVKDLNLKDKDFDSVHMYAEEFSGVFVLQATKTMDDNLILFFDTQVESGNFFIAILIDGEYFCDIPIDASQQIILNNISDKTVLVKIAGESAKFDISVERTPY